MGACRRVSAAGGRRCVLTALGAVAALLLGGCSRSHRPGDGFMVGDPVGAGTRGDAGAGASPDGAGRAGRSGSVGMAGSGMAGTGRPDPFFNCGGFRLGACAGNAVGVCHDDGSYELTPCAPGAVCSNSGSGGECVCPRGSTGNGFVCNDVDECADGTARCSIASSCVNVPSGYACGSCGLGYDDLNGDGTACVDIDECATGSHGCDPLSPCTNTSGSYSCGACPTGYLGSGNFGCAPGLLDLHVLPGELVPPFATDITYYNVDVPVLTETLAIAATPLSGAMMWIDGSEADPRVTWVSGWLEPGVLREFTIDVAAESSQSTYHVTVWRDPRPFQLLPGDGSSSFGRRVAVSGSEVVVAAPLADPGGAVHVYSTEGYYYEQARLTGDAVQAEDRFGNSIAISDGVIAVGAPWDGAVAANSGAVYVFEQTGAGWAQQAYLKASNAGDSDNFGNSVALHAGTLVVGAPFEDGAGDGLQDSGAVYVFVREATGWVERAYLKAGNAGADDGFGAGVALHEGTLVVAAPLEDGGAPGVNGNAADESAPDSGAAYVFVGSGGSWMQQAYLKASNPGAAIDPMSDPGDQFGGGESLEGRGVAVFGDTIAVGAASEDSSGLGVNGVQNDESSRDSGAVYVFVRTGTSWAQEAYLKAGHRAGSVNFGASIALWQEQLVVGAPQAYGDGIGILGDSGTAGVSLSGAAYVFERTAGAWAQRFYLKASQPYENDWFGYSVAAGHGLIAVGTGGVGAGAASAYVFR